MSRLTFLFQHSLGVFHSSTEINFSPFYGVHKKSIRSVIFPKIVFHNFTFRLNTFHLLNILHCSIILKNCTAPQRRIDLRCWCGWINNTSATQSIHAVYNNVIISPLSPAAGLQLDFSFQSHAEMLVPETTIRFVFWTAMKK